MYVVVTTSGEDEKKAMPLPTLATAKGYAATKAYDHFDGDVDSVRIIEIDDEDLRSARDRVLAGEGKVVAEVEQAVTDDRRQREELREATRLLASIGFGSTSRKAD